MEYLCLVEQHDKLKEECEHLNSVLVINAASEAAKDEKIKHLENLFVKHRVSVPTEHDAQVMNVAGNNELLMTFPKRLTVFV